MNDANASLVSALRGPVVMITVGVLFLFDKFGIFQFGQSWPVLLIVLGALALAGSRARGSAPAPGFPPYPARPRMDPPPPPPPGVRR